MKTDIAGAFWSDLLPVAFCSGGVSKKLQKGREGEVRDCTGLYKGWVGVHRPMASPNAGIWPRKEVLCCLLHKTLRES